MNAADPNKADTSLTTAVAGRTAVVTGGSNGLGAGVVAALAKRGALVFSVDLVPPADGADGERHPQAVAADVRDADAVRRSFDAIVAQTGRIDILVNCHGVLQSFGTVADTSDDEMRRVMSVNFEGTFVTCRAVAPIMARQGSGRIINLASDAGRQPWPEIAVYCASKAAVISLSQALAMELGPEGVTVNTVCPGVMLTRMTLGAYDEIARAEPESAEELLRAKAESLPVRRLGAPEDVGELVAWLASSASGFMTGALLNLTGGENFF
jgi:NAD(P)-dependent dehydrogenase (short-subunit alcohol dehydrogenase family)